MSAIIKNKLKKIILLSVSPLPSSPLTNVFTLQFFPTFWSLSGNKTKRNNKLTSPKAFLLPAKSYFKFLFLQSANEWEGNKEMKTVNLGTEQLRQGKAHVGTVEFRSVSELPVRMCRLASPVLYYATFKKKK